MYGKMKILTRSNLINTFFQPQSLDFFIYKVLLNSFFNNLLDVKFSIFPIHLLQFLQCLPAKQNSIGNYEKHSQVQQKSFLFFSFIIDKNYLT